MHYNQGFHKGFCRLYPAPGIWSTEFKREEELKSGRDFTYHTLFLILPFTWQAFLRRHFPIFVPLVSSHYSTLWTEALLKANNFCRFWWLFKWTVLEFPGGRPFLYCPFLPLSVLRFLPILQNPDSFPLSDLMDCLSLCCAWTWPNSVHLSYNLHPIHSLFLIPCVKDLAQRCVLHPQHKGWASQLLNLYVFLSRNEFLLGKWHLSHGLQ